MWPRLVWPAALGAPAWPLGGVAVLPSGVPGVCGRWAGSQGKAGGWGGWVGGFGASVAETGAPKPLDFARTALNGVLLPLCSL